MNDAAFLSALQLADSAFPIGRFVHSGGLEALLGANPLWGREEIAELVDTVVLEAVAPLDGVAVALAHRAAAQMGVDELVDLDRAVTARKLSPAARRASTSCGRRLAALVPLLTAAEPAVSVAALVRTRGTDGNLPVVEGMLAAALDLGRREAVLLALRGAASGLLSAAVRLDRLSAFSAQAVLRELHPRILEAAEVALRLERAGMRATAPELEIHALIHGRADARLFTT